MSETIKVLFTHYGIGDRDGVNALVFRNIIGLQELDKNYEISLAGNISPNIEEYEQSYNQNFDCIEIPEFSPGSWDCHIEDCTVQEYVDIGMKLFEIIREKFAPFDIIIVENLQVGNFPPLVYAFYMYARWCYEHKSEKRFIYRAHDFFWDRPENLKNAVKFNATINPAAPDWHTMFFPNLPNVYFVAINNTSMHHIFKHGIPVERLKFLPNCIGTTLNTGDEKSHGLREQLKREWNLKDEEQIIFSPVRCAPRKNIEESLLLLQVLNRLNEDHPAIPENLRHNMHFHLVLSMNIDHGKGKKYSDALVDFVNENGIPAHIGFHGRINLERTIADDGSISHYSLSDAYAISRAVLSTSTLEGFGFVFIEPWYALKPLFGRDIPDITYDFKVNGGMKFRQLYKSLMVNGIDFPLIGSRSDAFEQPGNILDPEQLEKKLAIIKRVPDNDFFFGFVTENRRVLEPIVQLLRNPGLSQSITQHNCTAVEEHYTREAAARILHTIITDVQADPA